MPLVLAQLGQHNLKRCRVSCCRQGFALLTPLMITAPALPASACQLASPAYMQASAQHLMLVALAQGLRVQLVLQQLGLHIRKRSLCLRLLHCWSH